MRDAAFQAMQFAHKVRAGQIKKHKGSLRRAPEDTLCAMSLLYSMGLRVRDISEFTGVPSTAIRSYADNHGLARDRLLFDAGVACLAQHGESFVRASWAPHYYVSDFGRVVGMTPSRPGLVMKPYKNPKTGYLSVKLLEADGVSRHNYIHRAVLRAFVGEPPDEDAQAAHNDGVKTNNLIGNLRWDTPTGNASDKAVHGTLLLGSGHPNAKIDEGMAAKIKERLADHQSQADIARSLNVSVACVANIAQGRTWNHVVAMARSQAGVA